MFRTCASNALAARRSLSQVRGEHVVRKAMTNSAASQVIFATIASLFRRSLGHGAGWPSSAAFAFGFMLYLWLNLSNDKSHGVRPGMKNDVQEMTKQLRD